MLRSPPLLKLRRGEGHVALLGSFHVYYSAWLRKMLGWRSDLNVLNANPATISLKKILPTPKRNYL